MPKKEGTRGQKQIKQENESTLTFYTYLTLGSYLPGVVYHTIWGRDWFSYSDWILLIFSSIIFLLCLKAMHSMAKSNLDLNMREGMGEHLKDILLVTVACQVLGAFSKWLWLLWLLIPLVAMYKLWVNILAPWIFQPAEEPTEKQKRKMDRKLKRQ